MNKKIISIFLLYLVQLVASSCIKCDCPSPKTSNITFTGLELKTWDTAGFQDVEVTNDSIYKNAFGLSIKMYYDEEVVAMFQPKKNTFNSLGFMAAYACSCADDEYNIKDPISSIVISATNTKNQQVTDVSSNFTVSYGLKNLSISEYIEIKLNGSYYRWHEWFYNVRRFELDLAEYETIPDNATFTVKIILKSGKELTSKTQQINFK